MTPPSLLDDQGRASVATALMMSHHGFRRDLRRMRHAVARVEDGDRSRVAAVQHEWTHYAGALHGHHQAEDQGVFPSIASGHPDLAPVLDALTADHRRIDPLLERANAAFADLPETRDAGAALDELKALLDAHLATEEREVLPHLREARSFPLPTDDATMTVYAGGFAWAMDGIARDVVDALCEILPPELVRRLPAARAEFAARRERAFGQLREGAARTPFPDEE